MSGSRVSLISLPHCTAPPPLTRAARGAGLFQDVDSLCLHQCCTDSSDPDQSCSSEVHYHSLLCAKGDSHEAEILYSRYELFPSNPPVTRTVTSSGKTELLKITGVQRCSHCFSGKAHMSQCFHPEESKVFAISYYTDLA